MQCSSCAEAYDEGFNNNSKDNLYGAVTRPCRYQGHLTDNAFSVIVFNNLYSVTAVQWPFSKTPSERATRVEKGFDEGEVHRKRPKENGET